jgi:prepilin-type processing-associated H-X9-DG protein
MTKHPVFFIRWFSLVELLIIVAILLVLLSLLQPSLSRALQYAKSIACATNLKTIYSIADLYQNENNGYLPYDGDSGPVPNPALNLSRENGMVQLQLYAQGLATLPWGNYKHKNFICPSDIYPLSLMDYDDERMVSYAVNGYLWERTDVGNYVTKNLEFASVRFPQEAVMFVEAQSHLGYVKINNSLPSISEPIDWLGRSTGLGIGGGTTPIIIRHGNLDAVNFSYFDGHVSLIEYVWTTEVYQNSFKSLFWGYIK